MAQATTTEVKFLINNYLNHVLDTGIKHKLLPTSFNQLIGHTNRADVWQKAINEGIEQGFVFATYNNDKQAVTFLRTFSYGEKLNSIPVIDRTEAINNFMYFLQFGVRFQIRQMGVTALYSIAKTADYMLRNAIGFTNTELNTIGKAVGVRLTTTQEDFLGICLGGKKCKARKESRQKNRIERRAIRTDKLKAKKDSLVIDNQAALSTNKLLEQIANPQEQVQQREIAEQNAMPPIPQNNTPKKEDNTLLWVGGFGTLIILGLILFLVLKK